MRNSRPFDLYVWKLRGYLTRGRTGLTKTMSQAALRSKFKSTTHTSNPTQWIIRHEYDKSTPNQFQISSKSKTVVQLPHFIILHPIVEALQYSSTFTTSFTKNPQNGEKNQNQKCIHCPLLSLKDRKKPSILYLHPRLDFYHVRFTRPANILVVSNSIST